MKREIVDGYDLSDPKEWGLWVAADSRRRRGLGFDLGPHAQTQKVDDPPVLEAADLNNLVHESGGFNLSPDASKGLGICAFLLSEIMHSDFIDEVPITQLYLQLKVDPKLTKQTGLWKDETGPFWYAFPNFWKLFELVFTEASRGNFEAFGYFNPITDLLTISTKQRILDGQAQREDLGNIDLPTYGAGKKDNFPEVLINLIALPCAAAYLNARVLGLPSSHAFELDDDAFAKLQDSWNNVKDRYSNTGIGGAINTVVTNRLLLNAVIAKVGSALIQ